MTRIFLGLAAVALLLLCTNLYLGLTGGDYNGVSHDFRVASADLTEARRSMMNEQADVDAAQSRLDGVTDRLKTVQNRTRTHMLFGVLAALVTVLVNSLCVTYFIGTGRWCKEVCDTYSLDASFNERARQLKKTTFPWSVLGIVTVLAIVALGAASDPGNLRESTANWVTPHWIAAMTGIAVIAAALWFQYLGIESNFALIDDVMGEVHQIRKARGLQVESGGSSAPVQP